MSYESNEIFKLVTDHIKYIENKNNVYNIYIYTHIYGPYPIAIVFFSHFVLGKYTHTYDIRHTHTPELGTKYFFCI